MQKAVFVGSSRSDIRRFPQDIREDMGYQIYRVQCGFDPSNWKPMRSVGSGVRELRVRGADNHYRCLYITTIGDTVYVLHVFMKQSEKTPKSDIEIAQKRLSQIRRRK